MNRSFAVATSLMAAVAAGAVAATAADTDEIVVAVMDFDNVSGHALPDLGPAAHEVLNSYLVGLPNVSVVTRDKLDAVLREQGLSAAGLTGNDARSSHLGQLLGADYMITGSVVQYAVERRAFNSYGVNTVTNFHRMKISLQVVDLKTARMSFSRTYDLEFKDLNSNRNHSSHSEGRERDLLALLVEKASGDLQKAVVAKAGPAAGASVVKVPVSTDPAGADVELNGLYIGSTPAELDLPEGVHVLKLVLQGFRPWEKKVRVAPGLKVSVTLAPLPPEEKITIETKSGD